MKDWKDIIYEAEVDPTEDYYSQLFHIDDRTVDKVKRIPIKFNTQFVLEQSLEYRIKQSIFVKEL